MNKKDSDFIISIAKKVDAVETMVALLSSEVHKMNEREVVKVKKDIPAKLVVSSVWQTGPTQGQTIELHNKLAGILSGYGILQANIQYVHEIEKMQ